MRRNAAWLWYGALLLVGAALYWLCRFFPADLPFWMPWEFSWPEFLGCALALAWFGRGLARLPGRDHPPFWRKACFVAGLFSF